MDVDCFLFALLLTLAVKHISFVVSQDLDLGLKEWFGHIQLSFDGPQLPVYVSPLIPPTITSEPILYHTEEAQNYSACPHSEGWLCLYPAERLFRGKSAAGTAKLIWDQLRAKAVPAAFSRRYRKTPHNRLAARGPGVAGAEWQRAQCTLAQEERREAMWGRIGKHHRESRWRKSERTDYAALICHA